MIDGPESRVIAACVDQTLRELANEYLRGGRGDQPIAVTTLGGTPIAVGQP